MAPQLWKNMWFCDHIETTIHMTWVPRCIAFPCRVSCGIRISSSTKQLPASKCSYSLSGFPFLRVRLRKAPLPSSKSSCQGASGHFNADSPWLFMVAQHPEALYTQHLSLRHLMRVCSWSLESIHPRLPWWNFIWHREMQVAKTKRFRTAEINSPISERSTDTNCKRSSNRIRYAVGTWLLRFGLWRWTQSVWITWLSTNWTSSLESWLDTSSANLPFSFPAKKKDHMYPHL